MTSEDLCTELSPDKYLMRQEFFDKGAALAALEYEETTEVVDGIMGCKVNTAIQHPLFYRGVSE